MLKASQGFLNNSNLNASNLKIKANNKKDGEINHQ